MLRISNLVGSLAITVGLVGCGAQTGAGAIAAGDEPGGIGVAHEAATGAAATGTQNVKVVNTTAEPVPTVAQGTTSVSGSVAASQSGAWSVGISGTPTVSAQQSGAWTVTAEQGVTPWSVMLTGTPTVALAEGSTVAVSGSVNIANTPSVNIANTPTVNVANLPYTQPVSGTVNIGNTPDVKLANDAANPALVRNTDERGRQPFQHVFRINIIEGQANTLGDFYSVPAGKRVVVEHVSGKIFVQSGQVPFVYSTTSDGVEHFFTATKWGSPFPGHDVWLLSQQTTLYSDGANGGRLWVTASHDYTPGDSNYTVTLTGYLVDL